MKRISYADSHIDTDDTIADLVLRYAQLLAKNGSADTVTIPFRSDTGQLAEVSMVIGPASQVTAVADGHADPFLGDTSAAIADLERRIRVLTPGNVPPDDSGPAPSFDDFDELDGRTNP